MKNWYYKNEWHLKVLVCPKDRYGRLSVIDELPRISSNRMFLCLCDCGNVVRVALRGLRNAGTKSCGCLISETTRAFHTKHGECRALLNQVWREMRSRCNSKTNPGYKNYGGRGIRVCKDWDDYKSFRDWAIKNGYKKGLSIERNDVNGNYEPSNCRFIPLNKQSLNTRRTIKIKYHGLEMCEKHWARVLGLNGGAFKKRINKWGVDKAITTDKATGMKSIFVVHDRINFRDVSAVIKVNLLLDDHDCLEILAIRDDNDEVPLSPDQEYQIKQTFMREYSKEHNEILNQHSERVEEIKNLRAA